MIAWSINLTLIYLEYFAVSFYSNFNTRKRTFLFLSAIHLIIIVLFKDNSIFSDLPTYIEAFELSKTVSWSNLSYLQHYDIDIKLEYGWVLYTKIISSIVSNYKFFLGLTGTFIILSYIRFINRFSKDYLLSTFLFVSIIFYNSLFVLRQHFAVAILLHSIPYILDRKFIKFLIFQSVAILFHQSAVIFFPIYFLVGIEINKRNIALLLFLSFILSLIFKTLLGFVGNYIIWYQVYSSGIGDFSISNSIPFLISLFVFGFVFLTLYPFNDLNKIEWISLIMLLVILTIDFSRIGLTGTLGRLNFYFFPGILILLPKAITKVTINEFKLVAYLFIYGLYFTSMLSSMLDGFRFIF